MEKVNCNYCGKPVGAEYLNSGDLYFCNTLCQYLYSKNGTNFPIDNGTLTEDGNNENQNEPAQIFLNNLDFNINIPGIQMGRLILRAGYFRGLKVYLDSQRLKPVQKSFFKRTKTYLVRDEENQLYEIKLKKRYFDAIPVLYVNGETAELAPKLKWYEYLWIFIPLLLVFGGFFGALIGGTAAFTNSILFRKIKRSVLKYSMVIINTVVAWYFFANIFTFIMPYLTEFQFNIQRNQTIKSLEPELVPLTKHIWESYKVSDSLGNDYTSSLPMEFGTKRYFFNDGNYFLIPREGTVYSSEWKILDDKKRITLTGPGVNDTIKIVSLTDSVLVFGYKHFLFTSFAD